MDRNKQIDRMMGKVIELSSASNGDRYLKMLIFTLDKVNVNKVGVKEIDNSEDKILALDGQPVVAKVYDKKGGKTLGGHEATKVYYYENGKRLWKYKFGTNAVGVWQDTQIEDMEIDGETKRVVTSVARVWKRFPNVIEAIDNLIEKEALSCSYEINGYGYDEDGVTWKTDIEYMGVALLGVKPAYPEAVLLEDIAEVEEDITEEEMALTIALSQDLSLDINNKKGSGVLDKNKKNEIASLTSGDIYSLVTKAIRAYEESWTWVCHIMPYEFVAYARKEEGKDMDYIKYTFVVNSDDTVSITGKQEVEMVFAPKEETVVALAEKDKELAEKASQIITINETITTLQSTIEEKEGVIAELEKEVEPLREQAKQALAEKEAQELAEKQEKVKQLFLSTKLFTEEELSEEKVSEEISEIIKSCDTVKAQTVICERVVANAQAIVAKAEGDKEENISSKEEQKVEDPKVELSQEGEFSEQEELMTFKPRVRRR